MYLTAVLGWLVGNAKSCSSIWRGVDVKPGLAEGSLAASAAPSWLVRLSRRRLMQPMRRSRRAAFASDAACCSAAAAWLACSSCWSFWTRLSAACCCSCAAWFACKQPWHEQQGQLLALAHAHVLCVEAQACGSDHAAGVWYGCRALSKKHT